MPAGKTFMKKVMTKHLQMWTFKSFIDCQLLRSITINKIGAWECVEIVSLRQLFWFIWVLWWIPSGKPHWSLSLIHPGGYSDLCRCSQQQQSKPRDLDLCVGDQGEQIWMGLVSTICENHVGYLVLRCTLLLNSIWVHIYRYIILLWFINVVCVHVICSKKWPKTGIAELKKWPSDRLRGSCIPGQGQTEECSLVGCLLVR